VTVLPENKQKNSVLHTEGLLHSSGSLAVGRNFRPCPALSAHADPKSQGHCRKWHHEAESLMTDTLYMYIRYGP